MHLNTGFRVYIVYSFGPSNHPDRCTWILGSECTLCTVLALVIAQTDAPWNRVNSCCTWFISLSLVWFSAVVKLINGRNGWMVYHCWSSGNSITEQFYRCMTNTQSGIRGFMYLSWTKDHIEKIDVQEHFFAVVNWPIPELYGHLSAEYATLAKLGFLKLYPQIIWGWDPQIISLWVSWTKKLRGGQGG